MVTTKGISAPSKGSYSSAACEFWLGARREEGEYPLWSLTDESTTHPAKISTQPFGLGRRLHLRSACWLVK